MKISEELKTEYRFLRDCKAAGSTWSRQEIDLAWMDALQQVVAENLELKHIRDQHNTDASDCEGGIDWLAEADKLLRGEK